MTSNLPHADPVREVNQDLTASPDKKIDDLYHLIEGISVCMMTTRCENTGKLVSRAMSPRKPDSKTPADLWFFANNTTHKFEELKADPNVNLGFYKPGTSEWVSVSGTAKIVNDRQKIEELYDVDIRAWFGDLGDGVHDGGAKDPRISLIFVKADTVHYSLKDRSLPVQMFNIAKGMATGQPPKVSAERGMICCNQDYARLFNLLTKSLCISRSEHSRAGKRQTYQRVEECCCGVNAIGLSRC
jgi:general stress protein 26